jgi:hypothetical protein
MSSDRLAEIIETLGALCRFDIRALYDEHSSLLPVAAWPAEASLAIVGLTSRELFVGPPSERVLVGVEHKLRLSDSVRALELALRELGALAPDRLPPEERDLDSMSDRELIQRVEYHIIHNPKFDPGHYWGAMSEEAIDEDFARVCASYDLMRPGMREKSSPEPVQRYLPPPPRLPPDFQGGPAPAPSAAPEDEVSEPILPDPPPESYRPPVIDRRLFHDAVDEYAFINIRMLSHLR